MIPFSYGKILADDNFTDRESDLSRLAGNFSGLVNTILISPRRWGKSSLVSRALKQMDGNEFLTISFDAFRSRDWESFLNNYASAIGRMSGSDREFASLVASLIPSLKPRITIQFGELTVGLETEINLKKNPMSVDEILDLPQKIAERKRKKVIVCIDEFQNIADYKDSLSIQKVLRSHWQTHTDVAYCLFGSKFNVMSKLISKPKMPFYKFGDVIYLQKISEDKWIPFIAGKFAANGKRISPENAALIARICKNHPYYVQQLSQISWLHTPDGKECTEDIVNEALSALEDQLSMQFLQTVTELTNTQLEYIRALCDGVVSFSSLSVLKDYRIGTAPNVINIKKTLERKEIITTFPDRTELQDPIFEHWLKVNR
uniref:Putative ATPase n=1 Tax=uncultured bacterium fosmid pJB92C9 TaxID=1478074 RepID=A0A0H3U8E1_9BACT|nr:putative ATPase [uncultured bacterium fosmid pJB92C9]